MARVFVVDDDPVIVRLVTLNLELEGHEVEVAHDGRDALTRVSELRPDLILLDVMMPHVDGFKVCEQLKADEATRDIPVVFLSARAQEADVTRGMAAGAHGYVTKPFDPLELVELIERVIADERRSSQGD